MKKGFYLYHHGKDYFFVTDGKNKTENIARKILAAMNFDTAENSISYILRRIQHAEMEIISLPSGKSYYDIHGKNFGGFGSFVGDGKTVVLYI